MTTLEGRLYRNPKPLRHVRLRIRRFRARGFRVPRFRSFGFKGEGVLGYGCLGFRSLGFKGKGALGLGCLGFRGLGFIRLATSPPSATYPYRRSVPLFIGASSSDCSTQHLAPLSQDAPDSRQVGGLSEVD